MRHNAMFEGCWAERLFLKYQNIKICAWKWWAEYLKYQNIQIICVLVPAACFKAGECEYLFSNIKAEHLSRFPPRGSHRLTTGHHLTSSYHVLKHQHHYELKPHVTILSKTTNPINMSANSPGDQHPYTQLPPCFFLSYSRFLNVSCVPRPSSGEHRASK